MRSLAEGYDLSKDSRLDVTRESWEEEMMTDVPDSSNASATQYTMPLLPPMMSTRAPESFDIYFLASEMLNQRSERLL